MQPSPLSTRLSRPGCLQPKLLLLLFSCSVMSDSTTRQGSLSFTISWILLKLMSVESVMPSNYLILCCPFLLPSIIPSIRVFFSELALHIRWPKYWSFSFNIGSSSEYLGLISFMIGWFDILAVQKKSWISSVL